MMANLFSSFDPTSSLFNLPLNWVSTFVALVVIPFSYWASPSRFSLLWSKIMSSLHTEFKALLGTHGPGSTMIFISVFTMVLLNNFFGLLPFLFTSTSHPSVTLALALPLWLAFFAYGWLNKTEHMFAHLVPTGTPPALMPVMVLIETISNIIRPGTLAIRLAANMMAGHLILTLLSSTGPTLPNLLVIVLLLAQILLLLLESAVAVIQSYVFAALSTLYAGEVN